MSDVAEGVAEKIAEIVDERFEDDDGIWRLPEESMEAIIEIARFDDQGQ